MARPRRSFTPEFKARLVLEALTGTGSLAELFGGEERASQEQLRVADLEQLVGRQTLELEILKKASRLLTGRPLTGGRSS